MFFRFPRMKRPLAAAWPGALAALACIALWAAAANAAMQVKTGAYIGDGQDDHAVTGLGFAPDVVIVKNGSQGNTMVRTSTMTGDISKALGTGSGLDSGEIKSLDPDGFTVGTKAEVNQNGATIYWVAFKADSAEMVVGSYVGDGSDDRSITGVGFSPGYVLVMNQSGFQASQRFAAQTGDASRQFDANGESSNRIQAFEPDGFQVGTNPSVNDPGQIIHYVAWALTPGSVSSGTYAGDGTDDRDVTDIGQHPVYMILADRQGNIAPIHRPGSLAGDASLSTTGGGVITNAIQAFLADGFQVGSHLAANALSSTYYWVALGQGQAVDIALAKSVDDASPVEGDTVSFSVIAANQGAANATGVRVSDLLPSGLTYVAHTVTQGAYDDATGLWTLGALAAGASDTLVLDASVDTGAGGMLITNTASLSAVDQIDENSANDQASAGVQAQTPLILTVSADPQGFATLLPGTAPVPVFRIHIDNGSTQTGTLSGLVLTNAASGTGTPADLDADWSSLSLYLDTGGSPALLGSAAMTGGRAAFSGLSIPVPAGGSVSILAEGAPSLKARDTDRLDLVLAGPGDVGFAEPAGVDGAWPVDPQGYFLVDGMSAAQITVNPVAGRTVSQGATRELALDVVVPANGYEPDVLTRFNVVNLGTAVSPSDITVMELWRDAGSAGFDPAQDVRLGVMEYTGNRWEVTGLSVPIPVSGLRLFVSLDVNDQAARTSSIQLAVPSGSDLGVGVASGNSGPLDHATGNDQIITVTTQDRVVLSAASVAPGPARPGDTGVLLLHLTAANSYAVTKTITGLRFTNAGTGPGTVDERDREIQLCTLYGDGDNDGVFDGASEPVLGTGAFLNGAVSFQNLTSDIAPGEIRHFFLAARISLSGARDGDILSARLQGPIDVGFADPTAAAGVWPVTSGAAWTVDGMVAAQIAAPGGGNVVLGPGDGPVNVFTFDLPPNGYEDDVLGSVRIENRGDAQSGDFSDLRLWADGGNGTFDGGTGDDADLGGMTWTGSGWQSLGLAVPVSAGAQRFFVSVSVAPGFTDSAGVDLVVPVNGVVMQTGNDGPLDTEVASPFHIQLSDAPLLARIEFSAPVSTVGQTVAVRMIVTNRGTESVTGVVPSAFTASGSGVLTAVTGPLPASLSLAPAATDTFTWTFRADGAGPVVLSGSAGGTGAVSGEPRSTRVADSPVHTVFYEAQELWVSTADLMPATITIGQSAVVPLSLTVSNPGGAGTSDIRLDRIRIRLEDETGAGIVPADLLNRVVVNEGLTVFLDKTSLETAGAEIDLPLGNPFADVLVPEDNPVTLSLELHLAATTTVSRFRVVITDASKMEARDANSGTPVSIVLENGTFPVRTGLANLVGAASLMTVTGAPPETLQAGPGQAGIDLMSLTFENPGSGNTSAARVGAFSVVATDGMGTPFPDAAAVLGHLEVQALGQTVYSEGVVTGSGDSLVLSLSPPIVVLENSQVAVAVRGSLSDTAAAGLLQLHLGPESAFDVRDGNTGDPIVVSYPAGPVDGNLITIQTPAREIAVSGSPLFPSTVTLGEDGVQAMNVVLEHPGVPGDAPIRVDALTINVRNEKGQALVPAVCLDRVRILLDGVEAVPAAPLPTTAQPITAALSGVMIPPGGSATMTVVVDIESGAPPTQLQLSINGTGIMAADANMDEPVEVVPRPGYELPLVSGITRLVLPARDLLVSLESLMPAALAADGSVVAAGAVTLANPAPDGSSPVRVSRLRFRGADRAYDPVVLGAAVTRLSLFTDGTLFAAGDTLGADSTTATLVFPQDIVLDPGKTKTVELRMALRPGPGVQSLRLGLGAADVGVVEPAGSLEPLNVRGTNGQSFPLWTEAGSMSAASLSGSYSNFPNPFNPRYEETTFVYFLPADGRVTLRLWSVQGEKVITLINAEKRSAGLHQDDRWDGVNGAGHGVMNGVYIAELTVQYADGTSTRLVRKVAVVQ